MPSTPVMGNGRHGKSSLQDGGRPWSWLTEERLVTALSAKYEYEVKIDTIEQHMCFTDMCCVTISEANDAAWPLDSSSADWIALMQELWLELSRCAAMCYKRGGRRRNAALLRLEVRLLGLGLHIVSSRNVPPSLLYKQSTCQHHILISHS